MPFEKKTRDALEKETIEGFGFDATEHKPIIDKIVADRLKDEDMKESLYKQKKKAQMDLEAASKAPKEDKTQTKEEIRQTVAEEMFLQGGGTNTALRQLHKIMTATGKSFVEAQKDSLYVAFKKDQDKLIKSRESQLPPSRGGSSAPSKETDAIIARNQGNLPPGFEIKTK